MAEHFDEGVLDGLVGVSRVAQILKRDAQRAALVGHHQTFEALPRGVHVALLDKRADFDGELRVF